MWGLRGAQLFWGSIDEQIFDNRVRCATLGVLRAFQNVDPNVLVNDDKWRDTVRGQPHAVIHGTCTERIFNYLQLRYRVLCIATQMQQYVGANATPREAFDIIFNGSPIYR